MKSSTGKANRERIGSLNFFRMRDENKATIFSRIRHTIRHFYHAFVSPFFNKRFRGLEWIFHEHREPFCAPFWACFFTLAHTNDVRDKYGSYPEIHHNIQDNNPAYQKQRLPACYPQKTTRCIGLLQHFHSE